MGIPVKIFPVKCLKETDYRTQVRTFVTMTLKPKATVNLWLFARNNDLMTLFDQGALFKVDHPGIKDLLVHFEIVDQA